MNYLAFERTTDWKNSQKAQTNHNDFEIFVSSHIIRDFSNWWIEAISWHPK